MAINYDWIISFVIILFIILLVWSRIEGKTIVELVEEIFGVASDKKDDLIDKGVEIYE